MKGLLRSLSRAPKRAQRVIKEIIKVENLALTVAGATGVGFGTVVAGDFPEGNISFLSAVAYLTFAGPTSGSLSDTWAGDFGVGTTPAADATLTGGDVDIVASSAIAAATAEVSPRTRGVNTVDAILDNTDGSLEVNLNLLIDDADISGDGIVMTCNGEIEILYTMMGDD